MVGGGGGGGGGITTSQKNGGQGGRGGQVVSGTLTTTGGETLTFTVGAGGNGGAASRNGVTGGTSSLSVSGGAAVSALGGNRGRKGATQTNSKGSGGANGGGGASNSNADNGGAGTTWAVNGTVYGGGGGGGASDSKSAGSGGSGGGGGGGTSGSAGTAGTTNFGAGGGGGGGHATTPGAGGAGGRGVIVIRYTLDTTAPTLTLARGAATSASATIFFTVTGNEAIDCTTLTAAADLTLTNLTIDSVQQTSTTVCTLTGASSATAGGAMVTSTVAAAAGFSVADVAGNAQTTLGSSPQSTDVTVPSDDVTAPTVRSVTSSTANGGYKAGDVISIQVNFSEVVTVTGTPTLTLATGGSGRAVNYASGTGTSTLTFTYTVQSGDNSTDLDYVGTGSLSLAGGTIADAKPNAATLTLASPGAAGSLGANKALVVDTTAPTVSSVASTNGTYYAEEGVVITVTFSENVSVTGAPSLTLGTSPTRYATADATSGTGLLMTYTIVCDDAYASGRTELDYAATGSLALNGGTITDAVGNAATLTLASPGASGSLGNSNNVLIDGANLDSSGTDCSPPPSVSSVNSTTDAGTFKAGGVISIQVNFSASVTVTGTPTLTLATGGAGTAVDYASGSPGTALTFTYTVGAGHTSSDLDYSSTGALALNGGTITSTADGSDAVLTLASPGASGSLANAEAFVIDTTAPTVSSFSSTTADGSYKAGQTVNVTATTSEAIQLGNTLTVTLETGDTDRTVTLTAAAAGTTLTGTYTVTAGDTTSDLTVASFTIGTVADAVGNAMTSTTVPTGSNNIAGAQAIVIDTTAPTATWTAPGSPSSSRTLSYTLAFSESVSGIASGDFSNAAGAGAATGCTFTPSAASGTSITVSVVCTSDGTVVLRLAASGVSDTATNAGPTANADASSVTIDTSVADTTAPTISTLSPADNATGIAPTANLVITFSETVTAVASKNIVIYTSAGAAVETIAANGALVTVSSSTVTIDPATTLTTGAAYYVLVDAGAFKDAANNTFAGIAVTTTWNFTIVSAPAISTVAISSTGGDDATLVASETLEVTVTFDSSVTVSVAGGTPYVTVALTNANRNATYSSGSPGTTLVFQYTIVSGDVDANGASIAANALTLNGGTITKTGDASTNAVITHSAVSAVDGVDEVDAVVPTFSSASVNAGGTQLTLTYGEALNATTAATSAFAVTVAGSAATVSSATVSGSTVVLALGATVLSGQAVTVAYTDPTAGNDANAVQDTAGNDAADLAATSATNGSTATTTTTTVASSGGGGGGGTTTTTVAATTTTTSTSVPTGTTTTVAATTTTAPPATTTTVRRGTTTTVRRGTTTTTTTTIARGTTTTTAVARGTTTTTTARGGSTTTTTARSATTTTARATTTISVRRITICHATSSESNPYVTITVDASGLNGHGDHSGDIIPAPGGGCPRGDAGTTTTVRPTSRSSSTTSTSVRPSTTTTSSSSSTSTTTTVRPSTTTTTTTTVRPSTTTTTSTTTSTSTTTTIAGTTTTAAGTTTTVSGTTSTTTSLPIGSLSSSSTTTTSTPGGRTPDTLPPPAVPTLPPTTQASTTTSSSPEGAEPPSTSSTTTLPPGTNTIEVNGRPVALAVAATGQAIDVGPAPTASPDDPTGGRNAFGLDRTSTRRTTLPILAAERFDEYLPGPALLLEVIGARTTAQFVVAPGVSADPITIAAALNESTSRLETDFARVESVEPLTAPDAASLTALADAKSTATLMSRIFADSELPTPTRLTDLALPKKGKWLKVAGRADGYVPGSIVYMAVTSDPIVFAEAVVGRDGRARLVGSFPVDLLPAGGHRVRIVGIRQVFGVTLDRDGEIQLAESAIARIAQFDTQTTATVRISGPNAWGGYHSAIRVVPLREPLPWWTLWVVAWTAFLALIARLARKLVSRRDRIVGTVLVVASAMPSQYWGWVKIAYGVNAWGFGILVLGVAIVWLVPPMRRAREDEAQ